MFLVCTNYKWCKGVFVWVCCLGHFLHLQVSEVQTLLEALTFSFPPSVVAYVGIGVVVRSDRCANNQEVGVRTRTYANCVRFVRGSCGIPLKWYPDR